MKAVLLLALIALWGAFGLGVPGRVEPLLPKLRAYEVAAVELRTAANGHHIRTLVADGNSHPSQVAVTLSAFGKQFELALYRHDDLVSPAYRETLFAEDHRVVQQRSVGEVSLGCYYRGHAVGDRDSLVAASTCDGHVHALVRAHGEHFTVDSAVPHFSAAGRSQELTMAHSRLKATELPVPHIVYRMADLQEEGTCGVSEHAQPGSATDVHSAHSHSLSDHFHSHSSGGFADLSVDSSSHSAFHSSSAGTCTGNPLKYTEVFFFNSYSRFQALGTAAFSTTLSVFNFHKVYYENTTNNFACRLTVRLIGQALFTVSDPTLVSSRACNTVDPNFVNAYPMTHVCCATTPPGATCPTPTPVCLQSAGGQSTSTAACFATSNSYWSSTSGDKRVTYMTITGISSQSATEIDTSALLQSFYYYMYTVRSNVTSVFSPSALDNAVWITNSDFASSTVGLAQVGSMCSASSGSVVQATSSALGFVAQITAHEMGHNFGMNHDGSGNTCPTSGYIMAASAGTSSYGISFSSCSQSSVDSWFTNTYGTSPYTCLDNDPGTPVWNRSLCGNGVLDAGEACDWGFKPSDSCCTAQCQFAPGCVCANTDPCCSNGAVVSAQSNTVCRAASGSCDLAETCNGLTSKCPSDLYLAPGSSCTGGTCFRGTCVPTFASQCNTLFGTTPCSFGNECAPYVSGGSGGLFCHDPNNPSSSTCYTYGAATQGSTCASGKQCFANACTLSTSLYDYYWTAGAWGTCSGGVQTRTVACIDQSGTSASTANCQSSSTAGAQPASSQSCSGGSSGTASSSSSSSATGTASSTASATASASSSASSTATATASSSASATASSTSSSTGSGTGSGTGTGTPDSSSSSISPAILGGAIGGGVVAIAVIVALVFVGKSCAKRSNSSSSELTSKPAGSSAHSSLPSTSHLGSGAAFSPPLATNPSPNFRPVPVVPAANPWSPAVVAGPPAAAARPVVPQRPLPVAPSPSEGSPWSVYYNENRVPYYYNSQTGESTWTKPAGLT